ncbi:MAG: ATP-binding cassette domain-containing protein, partial [Bacteroidia bacterium]|nr:ATP-binding cassette domain-containing protein [Bacteroidia bacterium]
QIASIVGNSGCGKSTLLNLLSGLLLANSGTINVHSTFSYLTQITTLLPYRNSFENSLLACELRNTLNTHKEEQASFLFQLFNLSINTKSKFPNELSGGMKQRVGLIQTLLVDAGLFLLDEPFNAIDRNTSLVIQNFIWNKLKNEKSSAIIVTHDLDQSILMSDKILIMSSGTNIYKEIIFDKQFTLLSPNQRINTELYNEYLIQMIKSLNA